MVVATPQHAAFPPTVISSPPAMKAMVTPNTTTTKKKSSGGGSKKKDAHDCPIFLKKTYHMIDGCDPAIASWAEDGKSFVIKDTNKFGTVVIPQFFKHNKISSFVRQLNFYGFRKVKVENIKINTALEETEGKYWRFRHEHFLRGRPDLLGDIRKANQMISPEQAEVDSLKKEVKNLKEKISGMTADIQKLTALVETVTQSQQQLQNEQLQGAKRVTFAEVESPTKKRKIDPIAAGLSPHAPLSACSESFSAIPDLPDLASATDSDLLIEHPPASYPDSVSSAAPFVLPLTPAASLRATSFGSVTSMDQDFAALFSDDLPSDGMAALEHIIPDITESSCAIDPVISEAALSPPAAPAIPMSSLPAIAPEKVTSVSVSPEPMMKTTSEESPDATLVHKLRDALACLPKKMQEVFVERLVATIATPEQFKESVQAVSALAAAAAGDAQRRLVTSERIPTSPLSPEGSEASFDSLIEGIEGDNEVDRIGALPLAAAALAAFLSQYAGNAAQDRQVNQMESSSSPVSPVTRTAPSVVPPES